jgi:hypothetical protein
MSQEILNFANAIDSKRPQPGDKAYQLFKSIFRRSNYFVHDKGFMIIKISRVEKPFWGVGKVYIDFLNEYDVNFFLVLLESEKSGYVFDKQNINRMILRKDWGLASDNNYKINSPLPERFLFRNVKQFLIRIGAEEA